MIGGIDIINTSDAIRVARNLIGTPYDTLDCINLIKKVIRTSPGGVKNYTTATTVSLWESIGMSAKYRDLTWRQESIVGAKAGMLAFKRYDKPADHVGIVTERGTVIHSSSKAGVRQVVETPLTEKEGWNGLGIIRHISVIEDNNSFEEKSEESMNTVLFKKQVVLSSGHLNLRAGPGTKYRDLGDIPNGAIVEVIVDNEWSFIRYNGNSGYVDRKYLADIPAEDNNVLPNNSSAYSNNSDPYSNNSSAYSNNEKLTIIDSAGNRFEPVGDYRVIRGSLD